MSNRSIIRICTEGVEACALGSKWGASSYGLAEQIEALAKARLAIGEGEGALWIYKVVEKAMADNPNLFYFLDNRNHFDIADYCWDMDLELEASTFDIMTITDSMKKVEVDEDVDLSHVEGMDVKTVLSWEECTRLSEYLESIDEASACGFWQDPEDKQTVLCFSGM